MEKRNTNRQREYRDDYRQHSPAWIRAQRRKRKRIIRRRIMIGSAVICIVERMAEGLRAAGLEVQVHENVMNAIWHKLLANVAINGMSGLMASRAP